MSEIKRTPLEPVFVGLDLSLTGTGVSVKQGGSITLDTIKTTPRTCTNDLARLRHIADECMKRIPKDVQMICVEDYFVPLNKAQIGSSMKLVALGTIVRMALFEAGYPFFIVSPGQLKKFITGKGNAQKSMIIKEVYNKWDIECNDDNHAEASVHSHMAEQIECLINLDAT
jgi:crossover junction endodeoxyribonuclease RuvC